MEDESGRLAAARIDFALDLGREANSQRGGRIQSERSVVNLFYWCNWITTGLMSWGLLKPPAIFSKTISGEAESWRPHASRCPG